MKIVATVFLLCFLFPIRLTAATILHVGANVEADVFVNGRLCGRTPLFLTQDGDMEIVLIKSGYRPATILHRRIRKKRIMSATSGDPPRKEFLLADERFGMGIWCGERPGGGPYDFGTSYGTCVTLGSSSYPTAFAAVAPSETTRFALPYRATEYAPQQIYVYMTKSETGETSAQDWLLRRFIVGNFGNFVMGEEARFLATVSRMTGLTEGQIKKIVIANPTPDAAANAIAERAGEKK
ncbi:MAG TPA: hypothetical protein DCX19_04915 [Alphaproteobacteria bacterium]|nr:hypothetical protein [Alphaproteobacteria bacterium]